MKNYKQPLYRILMVGWAIAFAYFFGQLMWDFTPFQWPFNVVAGYAAGILAGTLLAFFVFDKIKPLATRAIIAAVVLVFVGAVSASLVSLAFRTTFMGLEIQELRDNAARQ